MSKWINKINEINWNNAASQDKGHHILYEDLAEKYY